ncbi:MAG: single-stranded-DNA-specific exonuclease RecJ [Thermoanaerobaculia bacterium]
MPIHDRWLLEPSAPESEALPVAALLRPLFARRGVRSATELESFCDPRLEDLHDPAGIAGMDLAAERILRAVRDRESILIYGDYDVDGVTSIVMLRAVLRALGGEVDFVIPHRLFDGYGLKSEVLDRVLAEKAVRLVITVDCGITSVDPVARAIEQGIDVIVTDHHLPPELLPEAAAVLNPRQPGCTYPYKDLAGVGVAFKLCCELLRRAGHGMSISSLVKIAAIGTIADVAPLTGENRALVRMGLAGLADPRNPGLRALLRELGLLGRPLRASDVGFKIGPRINAAGRLASANTAIDLFDARTEAEAAPLVAQLEQMNRQRRTIEGQVMDEAERAVEALGELPRILVLWGEGWHKGVVGLCAGRLARKYHRPTLVISKQGDECVGSGRSIPTIDLHGELSAMGGLFTKFGGHAFACGFSLDVGSLAELRSRLEKSLAAADASRFVQTLALDAELELSALDSAFTEDHDRLEPFGQENRQPAFLARGVTVDEIREFSPGCNRLTMKQASRRATAISWPSTSGALETILRKGGELDLVFHLAPDRYDGHRLEIVDAAVSGEAPLELTASADRTWFEA